MPSVTQIRVRYKDTDTMSVVYYGNYLTYFEVARVEYLRQKNLPMSEVNRRIHMPVVEAFVKYVKPAKLDDLLEVTSRVSERRRARKPAVALGWPLDRIVVIDSDLGQSGASAADREGFQRLVTEVSLGRVGIVLGLEVSRLARNNTDWHRLLELCALGDTLILDEDGLYDPAHFNDRLLLGLKGTMSEAELHVLRARLRGGILSRARRGELKQMVPVGFVHDARDCVILDPDAQVQAAVRLFFDSFRRTGSCLAVVKEFHAEGFGLPRRLRSGAHKGELVWTELLHCRARQIIHNPRYAGAFVFGRTKNRRLPNGKYPPGRSRARIGSDCAIHIRATLAGKTTCRTWSG